MANIKSKTRSGEAVYETLREMAIEYRFRPGEKINEVELASLLDVSRTPIREALNRMVAEEFIQFKKNYGFYCRNFSFNDIVALLEAFKDVQCGLLRHVVSRAEKTSLVDLSNYCQEIANNANSLPPCELARADEAIFSKLSVLSGNTVLAGISRNLVARLRFLRKILLTDMTDSSLYFWDQKVVIDYLVRDQLDNATLKLSQQIEIEPSDLKEALSKGLGSIYLDKINMDVNLAP